MRIGKPQRDGAPADVGEADHALLHLEALDGGERLVGRPPLLDAPLQIAVRALFVAGLAMASTNVLFSALAWVGKSEWLFAIAVLLDDIAAAFATVAFVTFISL